MVVDELADILFAVDIDLQEKVVIAARRIELRKEFRSVKRIGNLLGFARSALQLHENRLHRSSRAFAACLLELLRPLDSGGILNVL